VDDLLKICGDYGLQIDWRADYIRIRSHGGGWEELMGVPFRNSVFRAILARVAVLCNERIPNSVSPYGVQGEVAINANPPLVVQVTFTNTLAEQTLRLLPASEAAETSRHIARDGIDHPTGGVSVAGDS